MCTVALQRGEHAVVGADRANRVVHNRDFDAAEVELTAALSLFRRAGADGQVSRCEALRRDLAAARAAPRE